MSVSVQTRQAYSEISEFLSLLPLDLQNQIPKKLRDFFIREKDPNYIKNIDPDIPVAKQNFLEETLAIIALLNLQYWCHDELEKQRLERVYSQNEEAYQKMLDERYNPDNMFKKSTIVENTTETALVVHKKDSIWNRIKRFLKIDSHK